MHIPNAILLTTTALTLTTALPSNSNPSNNQNPSRARAQQIRQQRLAAFAAQKPLHTSALLAGAAAATPSVQKRLDNLRVRDLRTVTGEDGLWVSLEDIVARDGGKGYGLDEEEEEMKQGDEGEGRGYGREVEEQVVFIERREGWDKKGREKGMGMGKGNGAGEI